MAVDLVPLLANLGLLVAVFAAGFAVDRQVHSATKLDALPMVLQLLVGGVALAPIVFVGERLAISVLNGYLVSLAVSIALWIALPTALARVIDADPAETGAQCKQ